MIVVPALTLEVLITVIGEDGKRAVFDSIADLRTWVPEFFVRRVQILDDARPVETGAHNTRRGDAEVYDLEGQLVVKSPTIKAALEAYEWAYGLVIS